MYFLCFGVSTTLLGLSFIFKVKYAGCLFAIYSLNCNLLVFVIWTEGGWNTEHICCSNGRGLFCFPMVFDFPLVLFGPDHWKTKLLPSLACLKKMCLCIKCAWLAKSCFLMVRTIGKTPNKMAAILFLDHWKTKL